jgi:hypothetical protein
LKFIAWHCSDPGEVHGVADGRVSMYALPELSEHRLGGDAVKILYEVSQRFEFIGTGEMDERA